MAAYWYHRYFEKHLSEILIPGKVFVLYGPRRAGKTKLIRKYLESYKGKVFSGTGDDMVLREIFSSQQLHKIISNFKGYDLIFIDEAQRIEDIGWGLKMLVDHLPDVMIVVTGSSSFRMKEKMGEPLTGRQRLRILYPLSMLELDQIYPGIGLDQRIEELLIYGSYPEALSTENRNDKIEYLKTLRDSYLFKDILELENLRYSSKLTDLLKLLAFQIGQQVSLNELSNSLGIAKQSVERYLDLLEKAFVIKKLSGFSQNLRKEVSKTSRYYFWDNGIRNAIISNYNALDSRNDIGMLWENFLFIERIKKQHYHGIYCNNYFWRTYDKKEIDLIEERDGSLFAFEFKWKPKRQKAPKLWTDTYPNSSYQLISKDNYRGFIT